MVRQNLLSSESFGIFKLVHFTAVTAVVKSEMKNTQFRASYVFESQFLQSFSTGPSFPIGISRAFPTVIFALIEALSAVARLSRPSGVDRRGDRFLFFGNAAICILKTTPGV